MGEGVLSIFDTETHENLCHFPYLFDASPSFSPCSQWISCANKDIQCAEVHDVETGALKHSFGDPGDERLYTAWSPCGTKLLSCSKNKGLQVWDIATGVVVHEWDHIGGSAMVVTGDRVAMCDSCRVTINMSPKDVTIWDYTTGVEVLVLTCPSDVNYVALTPNQRFIASCCNKCVRVWNIETGECIFEDVSENYWTNVALSNDIVAAYSSATLCVWSISTGEQLLCRDFNSHSRGLAISSCGGVVMYGENYGFEIVDISHLS